jgi:hypothetical protein
MAIAAEKFFPKWIADNYAVFPPIVFFIAVLFGWGLFFEIDQRLMFILSFADFLLLFVVFLSVAIILVLAVVGFAAPVLRRWSPWLVNRELRASSILKYLMFSLMIGSGFLPGRLNIYGGFLTGLVVFLLFMVPALSAYQRGEIDRFRAAVLISLVGFSWMVTESGSFAGRAFVDGPNGFI